MAEYNERGCKDCLHYSVCYLLEHYGADEDELCDQFIPAADVEGVRHAEWVLDTGYTGKQKEIWVCSNCLHYQSKKIGGHRDNPNKMMYMHYCPFCGAKMDGKGDGE